MEARVFFPLQQEVQEEPPPPKVGISDETVADVGTTTTPTTPTTIPIQSPSLGNVSTVERLISQSPELFLGVSLSSLSSSSHATSTKNTHDDNDPVVFDQRKRRLMESFRQTFAAPVPAASAITSNASAAPPCPVEEERDDLYLVLPPPAGSFVGIKWRGRDYCTNRNNNKRRLEQQQEEETPSRYEALWIQKVEIKVSPWPSSSSSSSNPSPENVQGWVKFKVSLHRQQQQQHIQQEGETKQATTTNIMQDDLETMQFLQALHEALDNLSQRHYFQARNSDNNNTNQQQLRLGQSLEAAAQALLPLPKQQQEPHTNKISSPRPPLPSSTTTGMSSTSSLLCSWGDFRFVAVSKRRIQMLLPATSSWIEETNLVLRNVTSNWVQRSHDNHSDTTMSRTIVPTTLNDDNNNNDTTTTTSGPLRMRSWCIEGFGHGDGENKNNNGKKNNHHQDDDNDHDDAIQRHLNTFVSQTCPMVVVPQQSCCAASYPHFLAQIYFSPTFDWNIFWV